MILVSLLLGFIFIFTHFLITVSNFELLFKIDSIEHFIGGILVAFFIYVLTKKYFNKSISDKKIFYIQTISGAVFIGVMWEFMEYIIDTFINLPFNLYYMTQPSVSDTISDLFFDLAGSLIFITIILIAKKAKSS